MYSLTRWWPQSNLWIIPQVVLIAVFRPNSAHRAQTELYKRCKSIKEKKDNLLPYSESLLTILFQNNPTSPPFQLTPSMNNECGSPYICSVFPHVGVTWQKPGGLSWNSWPVDCASLQHLNNLTSWPCVWLVYISIKYLHNHQQRLDECRASSKGDGDM